MNLTEEQAKERMESSENLIHIFHKNSGKNFGGRKEGAIEKPPFLRNLIALVGHQDTVKNTAKAFETHATSVSSYKAGKATPLGEEHGELVEIKEKTAKGAREKALGIVHDALDQITVERMEGAKLGEIAKIAKDLAIVHEKMDEEKKEEDRRIQIVIMTPKTRDEADMEVIEIKPERT